MTSLLCFSLSWKLWGLRRRFWPHCSHTITAPKNKPAQFHCPPPLYCWSRTKRTLPGEVTPLNSCDKLVGHCFSPRNRLWSVFRQDPASLDMRERILHKKFNQVSRFLSLSWFHSFHLLHQIINLEHVIELDSRSQLYYSGDGGRLKFSFNAWNFDVQKSIQLTSVEL